MDEISGLFPPRVSSGKVCQRPEFEPRRISLLLLIAPPMAGIKQESATERN